MKLSFGMIFSIILIIIFLSFAFFAIKNFLSLGNSAQIAKFANNLQTDIDKAWKGTKSSQEKEYVLPSKIEYVCFANYSNYPDSPRGAFAEYYTRLHRYYDYNQNMFFYPVESAEGLNSKKIDNIDLAKITTENNPYCIKNDEGKIKILIEKKYGEALVTLR